MSARLYEEGYLLEKLALYMLNSDTPATSLDVAACAPTSTEVALDDILRIVAEGRSAENEPLYIPLWVEDEPFTWEDSIMYFAFTDRFRNGDWGQDNGFGSTWGVASCADFQGGDFLGGRGNLLLVRAHVTRRTVTTVSWNAC